MIPSNKEFSFAFTIINYLKQLLVELFVSSLLSLINYPSSNTIMTPLTKILPPSSSTTTTPTLFVLTPVANIVVSDILYPTYVPTIVYSFFSLIEAQAQKR